MLDLFGARMHIGCSPQGVALLRRNHWGRLVGAPVQHACGEGDAVSAVVHALTELLTQESCRNAALDLTVCDSLARLFVVTPPSNASHARDLDAAIALRFQQLYGDDATQWRWRAARRIDRPFLAVALPVALHEGVQALAQQRRVRLVGMVPHLVASWNRWHDQLGADDWFALAHDDVLTMAVVARGAVRAVLRLPLTQDAMRDADWLNACVARECLRLDLARPRRVVL
ncbi:MAG: hypothetical protein M3N23_09965, partial [Pseudomonadota bacterium]|nr:hypothetical protein [Pseudomonadota bacterium]